MASLFDAVLSAHFHTAYLRGHEDSYQRHSALSQPGVDFRPWKEHVDRIGQEGPILRRVLAPTRAMEAIHQYHRAAGIQPLQSHRSRHAVAEWLNYNWHHRELHGRYDPDVTPHLNQFTAALTATDLTTLQGLQAESVSTARAHPDEVYRGIFYAVHRPVVARSRGALRLARAPSEAKDFRLIESTVDANGVTLIQAQLAYSDSEETFDKVAKRSDPRLWASNFPEMWTAAYCIGSELAGLNEALSDRYSNPTPSGDDASLPGQSFRGYLFEHGSLELEGISLMDGTIVLFVDFDVFADPGNPKRGSLRLKYRLHEPLTSSVICFQSVGGPDVDSAEENDRTLTAVAPSLSLRPGDPQDKSYVYEVRLDDAVVTTRVGKHLRYGKNVHFSEELNAIALPMWSWAVVGGLYMSTDL
jgi:hypothetical protein